MQKSFATPQFLLETSVLMANTDRIGKKTWSIGICQDVLRQTKVFYFDLINSTALQHGNPLTTTKIKPDIELFIRFLRETLNPFMIKWESVFFRRDQKPRRWTSHKNRHDMQEDFLTITGITSEFIDELNEIDSKKGASSPEALRSSGIN